MNCFNHGCSRREFGRRLGLGAGVTAALGGNGIAAQEESGITTDPRILKLHAATGVFDGYTKPVLKFTRERIEPGRFIERDETTQAGLWRLRSGHVRMANLSVGVPRHRNAADREGRVPVSLPICNRDGQVRIVLRQLEALYQAAEERAEVLGIARTVAEAERMNHAGRLALFLHLTGAWIADDLAVLRAYRRMGVVSIHPCIEGHHTMGDAPGEIRMHGGLTPLGREVVREMNRLNLVVDVAHGTTESIREMVQLSTAPVIYSHGGCHALCDNPRNVTDELIRAIAAKGGVVGITFVSAMLDNAAREKGGRNDPRYREAHARVDRELMRACKDPYEYLERRADGSFMPKVYQLLGWPPGGLAASPANRSNVERVVDHIDHVVKLVGVEHVGIGSDYETGDVPNGLEHAGKLPNLTAALLRRGHSEADIGRILTGNFQRVYRQVLGGA